MTVPLNVQPVNKVSEAAVVAAAVRKRRRRAPAGGAADDCFACAKRNVKCDRRRPYCSQCLELGNECSGYKTQLTWGVGVASRGKLRGLSLPIAKAPPVSMGSAHSAASGISKRPSLSSPSRMRAESVASAMSAWSDADILSAVSATPIIPSMHAVAASHPMATPRSLRDDVELAFDRSSASMPTPPFSSYELAHVSPTHVPGAHTHMPLSASVPVTMAHQTWSVTPPPMTLSPYSSSLPAEALSYSQPPTPQQQHHHQHRQQQQQRQPAQLQPQQQSHYHQHKLPNPHGLHLSTSTDSLSNVDYLSPISHSFPGDEVAYLPSPAGIVYDSMTAQSSPVSQSPPVGLMIERHRTAPTSCPGLDYAAAASEASSSLPSSHPESFDAHLSARLLQECDSMVASSSDLDAYSSSAQSAGQYWGTFSNGSASPQLRADAVSAAAWNIMDGQNSQNSQTTQPIVTADLVAKMPFFIDYYENTMCPSMVFIDGPSNPFRTHIMQLARSSRSLQHAICALAACNLRMKRKLSLGQRVRDVQDTVDDGPGASGQSVSEEYQHRNLAVHLLNEQLNDPVKSRHDSVLATILLLCHYRMAESGIARFHTHFAGVKKILALRRASPYQSPQDYAWMEALFTYFDAISASINDREVQLGTAYNGLNGESQLLPPGFENLVGCDRELFCTIMKLGRLNMLSQSRGKMGGSNGNGNGNGNGAVSPLGSPMVPMYAVYEDQQATFWREWKEARLALQSWEFDQQRVAGTFHGVGVPTTAQLRDLGSLSEAFRHAALLYTERLANPMASSADNNFRNFVTQVVYYATSLEAGSSAEKFLLWPLFVAGSECVNDLQQTIIRTKCRDIMGRSGYMNNLAALDVLEQLWADNKRDEKKSENTLYRAPFSWNRCIGGPGIEMEWIMF